MNATRLLRPLVVAPTLTFLAGLAVTIAAAAVSSRMESMDRSARFTVEVDRASQAVVRRVETYVALLRGGAGLFVASADVTTGEFRAYVEQLQLHSAYRGIQGLGFAGRSGDGFPIRMLEPQDRRNRAALGYDMFSDPVRRAAMECARDTAAPCASGTVTLVQEIDEEKQAGFLIYLPVYEGGVTPPTQSGRRDRIFGFVYAPFRAGDFLRTVMPADPLRPLDVEVFTDAADGTPTLLYASLPALPAGNIAARQVTVAGRVWTLRFAPGPGLEDGSGSRQWPLVVAAVFGAALVSWLVFLNVRAREARLAAVEQLNEQLQRTDRMKDEFLATLSHELRTPLHAILGWTMILKEGRADRATTDRAIETIERNTRAQAALVEDVLDLSRIARGKLKLTLQPAPVAPIVQGAIDSVRPSADARQVGLVFEHHGACVVVADRDRLQQVVWNLLANAVKFTPAGGRIEIALREAAGRVVLVIRDTGVGIPSEFLPHVFERFRQGDPSPTRVHGGLGLGLAIVRHLVEAHGGTVSAASDGSGRGATFTVELPAAPTHTTTGVSATQDAPDRLPTASRGARLGGLRVLAVDDEPEGLEAVAAWLTHSGAEVRTAHSGREALDVLEGWRPDVILSDVGMPGMDGWQFMREVRTRPPGKGGDVPAAALTAYAQRSDRDRTAEAGFQAHLAKPVDPEALVSVVAELVTRARRPAR